MQHGACWVVSLDQFESAWYRLHKDDEFHKNNTKVNLWIHIQIYVLITIHIHIDVYNGISNLINHALLFATWSI